MFHFSFRKLILLCALISAASAVYTYYYKVNNAVSTQIPVLVEIKKQEEQQKPLNFKGNKTQGFESTRQLSLQQLTPQGVLPGWLKGTLLATGPGQFELGDSKASYWFNGLAMVHGFYFDGTKVAYHNKLLDSVYYRRCLKNGKFDSSMSTEKPKGLFARLANAAFNSPEPYDNGNVNIVYMNDAYMAVTETPLSVVINPKTLATIGSRDLNDCLEGHLTTSKFAYDSDTHCYYNYMVNFGTSSSYIIYKINADNQTSVIATLPVKMPAYMRAFAMTKNYIILLENPLVVNPLDLLIGAGGFVEKLKWKPELGTNFIVINKHTGTQHTIFTAQDPFLIFNTLNAFEQNNLLIIDAVTYDTAEIIKCGKLEKLRSTGEHEYEPSYARRFTLDLKNATIKHEKLSDHSFEFPTYNNAHAMKPYRYVYGVGSEKIYKFPHKLIKLDINKKMILHQWAQNGCYADHPFFIAKPHAKHEDEGVILSVVLDCNNKKSFLLILDAQNFKELCRIYLPHHIPFGINGIFVLST